MDLSVDSYWQKLQKLFGKVNNYQDKEKCHLNFLGLHNHYQKVSATEQNQAHSTHEIIDKQYDRFQVITIQVSKLITS